MNNIIIKAFYGCSLLFIISFVNHLKAQSCFDGVMNGNEVGVDCGGPNCNPCLCTEAKLLLEQNSYSTEFHHNTKDWVKLRNDVELKEGSHTAFSAMNYVELSPTFEVKQGSEALFTIDNCVGYDLSNSINPNQFLETGECGTLLTEPNILGSPCNTSYPPVTIRLYLHIIRDDSGLGGIDVDYDPIDGQDDDLDQVKDEINQTFNRHGIAFEFCVREINSSEALMSPARNLFYELNDIEDGINGYIYPETAGSDILGQAEIGSNSFWAKISFGTPSHELGHCLNLEHTHLGYYSFGNQCPTNECNQERVMRPEECSGACPQFNCSSEPCVPNCYEAGDFLCDTPPDLLTCAENFTLSTSGSLNFPGWTDACSQEYVANNIIPSNVMSYWKQGIEITPEQACRAHEHIATVHSNFIVPNSQNCSGITANCPATEYSSSTWTTDRDFDRNVIVNGNLKIDGAVITFARGTGLTVNGNLEIINNSVIGINSDPPCNPTNNVFWLGIKLHHSATVDIYNSSIENSQVALSITSDPILTDNLPWIYIDNTTFLNNYISIQKSNSSGVLAVPDCKFLVTDSYLHNSLGAQVLMESAIGTNYLPFTLFSNLTENNEGTAIETFDSNFGLLGADIEGWDNGIKARSNLNIGFYSRACTYTNNRICINVNRAIPILRGNEFNIFDVEESGSANKTGVFFRGVDNFEIDLNTFTTLPSSSDKSTGIIINSSGAQSLEIINNEFTNLSNNIITYGNNGDANFGIQFLCNTTRGLDFNTNGNGEYFIIGSILPLQGSTSKPTGNIFAHDCYSTTTDFDFNGSQNILYYHKDNNIPQTPECYQGIELIGIGFENPDCSITTQLRANMNSKNMKDDIHTLNERIHDKTLELNKLLDNGQTENLLQKIRQQRASNGLGIINDLTNNKNMVSAEVIRELLKLSDLQPSAEMIHLIKENPSVLRDPIISDRVHAYIDYKTLKQSQPDRLKLEEDLVVLNSTKFKMIREAISQLFEIDSEDISGEKKDYRRILKSRQDLSSQMREYRSILSFRQDIFGCIQIIESYMYESNLEGAQKFVKELINDSNSIRDFDQEDLIDYLEIISIIDSAAKDNRTQDLLFKEELNRLYNLSLKETKYASNKAKGILQYYYNDVYESSLSYND